MSSNYDEDNAEALRKILPLIPEEVEYSSDREKQETQARPE